MLRKDFGATRIWVFGSLARGSPHDESDVDIGVEGLHPARQDVAAAELETLFRAPVDLVCMESAAPTLRARIHREATLL